MNKLLIAYDAEQTGTYQVQTTKEKYKRKFNDSLSGSVPEILVVSHPSKFSTAFSTKDYREGKKSRQNDEN